MTTEKYPHTYKRQRFLESQARQTRAKAKERGNVKIPPICGFVYEKRRPKRPPEGWVDGVETCVRNAGAGTNHLGRGYCDYHEVQAHRETSAGGKNAGRDVTAAKKIAYANASFFGEKTPTDPHMALMDEISRTAGIISWIESHMVELKDEGLSVDDVLTQYTKQNGFVASVWMDLYRQEREHLVRTCTAAIKAGVAERRVAIAEQQGQLIVAMMMAFIHDPELGLSSKQVQAAPAIMRRHLLAIPQETSASQHPASEILDAVVVEDSVVV